MKGMKYVLLLFTVIFLTAGCQDLYYMPFKVTGQGMGTAAFYLDGSPYRTSSVHKATGNGSASSCAVNFTCHSETHGIGNYNVAISIQTDENNPIQKECEYRVSGEQDIPYVSIVINGFNAEDGYVKFRKYESVISGNFEFTCVDDEGVRHSVKYGTFDVPNW